MSEEEKKADLTMVYISGFSGGEKKWKDKIREVIEKIKIYKDKNDSVDENGYIQLGYVIECLEKELLKEE